MKEKERIVVILKSLGFGDASLTDEEQKEWFDVKLWEQNKYWWQVHVFPRLTLKYNDILKELTSLLDEVWK